MDVKRKRTGKDNIPSALYIGRADRMRADSEKDTPLLMNVKHTEL